MMTNKTFKRRALLVLPMLLGLGLAGCVATRPPADVRVPPEILRGSSYTAGGERTGVGYSGNRHPTMATSAEQI